MLNVKIDDDCEIFANTGVAYAYDGAYRYSAHTEDGKIHFHVYYMPGAHYIAKRNYTKDMLEKLECVINELPEIKLANKKVRLQLN
jgi:hypothetical protein